MAVAFSTEISRAGALYVDYPENLLVVPELNGRHEHTDVEDLAADIAKNGQTTPVVIRKDDAGRPVLVFGHRRWRALCLLNSRNPEQRRKITCNYLPLTESQAFALAISENRFRKDVSPIDDAANIQTLMQRFGYSEQDIAGIYFPQAKSDSEKESAVRFVRQRASLIELAPEAAQAVRDGKVKLTAAVALSKLTKDQQRAKLSAPPVPKQPKAQATAKIPPALDTLSVDAVSLALAVLSDSPNWDEILPVARRVVRNAKKLGIPVKDEND